MAGHNFLEDQTQVDVATLPALLRWRATHEAERIGYVFLGDEVAIADPGSAGTSVTYADLDRRARAIAVRLLHSGVRPGDRAMLLYPPGFDFLAALFGCLYAGVVAVPTFPPDPARFDRTLPRLVSTVADATATAALTITPLLALADSLAQQAPEFSAIQWIATDLASEADAAGWTQPDIGDSTLAMLQYTSGSTGAPKGVMLTHRNLLHNSQLIHRLFGTDSNSRGLSWLPPYHDMGLIGGLLQPLFAGMPVWLMSPLDFLRRPASWLELISRLRVTISGAPNFAYELAVRKTTSQQRRQLDLSCWRVAFNGAEPIRRSTMARFAQAFAPAGFRAETFLPCYGLAEATLIVTGGTLSSTAGDIDPGALERGEVAPAQPAPAGPTVPRLVSCGTGAPDQQIEIVDPTTQLRCEPNCVGEVWLRGPSVAAGYWGRPALNRDVFDARIADGPEVGYLRTGDLGFVRNGELVVAGRLKDLIIVRGRNHHPQDIEFSAEAAHPALRPGCAAAFVIDGDAERLALVHEVRDSENDIGVAEIAQRIRHNVAQIHGIHVDIVALIRAGTLPKTSSGKIRRNECKRQFLAGELAECGRDESRSIGFEDESAPRSPLSPDDVLAAPHQRRPQMVERYLRTTIAAIAGLPPNDFDTDRPLLELGLDSLAVQQLRHNVEVGLRATLPLRDILAGASLARITALVCARLEEGATSVSTLTDGADASSRALGKGAADPLSSRLTAGERALWFLQHLSPHSAAHVTATAFRLAGPLDANALEAAFDDVLARHQSLQSTFPARDGDPMRIVHASSRAFRYTNVERLDDAQRSALLEDDANAPFELETGPLVRLHLYRRSSLEHVALIVAHHIVTDFWSTMILSRELETLYTHRLTGAPPTLAQPRATIADVADWQAQIYASPSGRESERYWNHEYEDGFPRLRLGAQQLCPSDRSSTLRFRLDPSLTEALKQRAAAEGVTTYVLLLAAFQALLHQLTAMDDVVIGTPVAARTQPQFAAVIGYLMNPVPLRSRVSRGMSFRDLLTQTRTRVLEMLEHQHLPSAIIAERRGSTQNDRLQVMFVFNQAPAADAAGFPAVLLGHPNVERCFGNLKAESLAVDLRECAFDLEWSMTELDDSLRGICRFRTEVLDDSAAQRVVDQFTTVLEAVASEPKRPIGSLLRATESDRVKVLNEWNRTRRCYGSGLTVVELFERQARRTPAATAIAAGDETISYEDLNERANRIADRLRAAGMGTGARVGICLDRGVGAVAAIIGALKVGAAYVPLDPVNPANRIAAAFADSDVQAVVTQRSVEGKLAGDTATIVLDRWHREVDDASGCDVSASARPLDPAYVIYTSGSSGRPKGVEVPHNALTNYTLHAADYYGISADDRVLQFASIAFDASAEEIYPTLIRGACLVLRDDRMLSSPEEFLRTCADRQVTVLDLPTAFWHELVAAIDADNAAFPPTVRLMIIGGEAARPDMVAAWHRRVGPGVRLVNTYGPTEATIVATSHELASGHSTTAVPIGRPVANTRVYLLDDELEPVSVGAVGEVHIAGTGLALGYVGRPGLTAERFVANPYATGGGRLYRTGDFARYEADGSLVFVARADRQVKIHGYRVELGEVESALRRLPVIDDAAAVPDSDGQRLIAYVVPTGSQTVTSHGLRAALRARLPGYMVPAEYFALEKIPRNTSGKVDTAALRSAKGAAAIGDADARREPPRTFEEQQLAAIWREVLDRNDIGRADDFFALGGHSLLATKVLARAHDIFGAELPLRAIFESPTVAALAERIVASPRAASAPITRVARDRPLPMSFVQERVWFLQQFEPESTSYNVPRALRMRGAVDVLALRRALDALESRHEILRTTFPEIDGVPMQMVHEPRGIPVREVDARGLAEGERGTWVQNRIVAAGQAPFDLAAGPLLHVTLVRLAAEEYVLILVEHHLIHDGWAQGVFLRDFLELYDAYSSQREPRLPDFPVQYADFAVWQREILRGDRLATLLRYWRRRLDGAPELLRLQTDRPRPKVLSSQGAQETLTVGPSLGQGLRALARQNDATLFMVMFAAFVTLLYGRSRQDDIVVGTGIANRRRPELEDLLGMIINTILLRTDLSGNPTFTTLLAQVRTTCLDAYAHQDMPFERLVEHLRPRRSLSHMPLFQVMFSFLDTPMPALRLPGLDLDVLDAHNHSAKFDLNAVVIPNTAERLGASETEGTVSVLLEYNTDLFSASTIRDLLTNYRELLASIVHNQEQTIDELLKRANVSVADEEASRLALTSS